MEDKAFVVHEPIPSRYVDSYIKFGVFDTSVESPLTDPLELAPHKDQGASTNIKWRHDRLVCTESPLSTTYVSTHPMVRTMIGTWLLHSREEGNFRPHWRVLSGGQQEAATAVVTGTPTANGTKSAVARTALGQSSCHAHSISETRQMHRSPEVYWLTCKSSTKTMIVHKTAYYGKLEIGTSWQTINVDLDTGSGNIMLLSTFRRSQACLIYMLSTTKHLHPQRTLRWRNLLLARVMFKTRSQ